MAKTKFNFQAVATKAAGLGAGAVGASMLDKMIPATIDTKIVQGGKVIAGAVLSVMGKGGILSSVGDGMIANGAANLAAALSPNTMAGIGNSDFYANIRGAYDLPSSIASTDPNLGE